MSEASNKQWLQRLKEESWEAELLVAAISIFGALQLFVFVEWVTDIFINVLPPSLYIGAYFVAFSALLAISILTTMFIIHFMLRAYWVGLVGLNSVFSDYSVEHSAFSKIYMERLIKKLPTLNESVDRADKLCSVIFSAAFGVLMAYGWMFIGSTLYLMLVNSLSSFISIYLLLAPVFCFLILIVIQSLLSVIVNFARFKENERFQIFAYKLTMLVSMLSFGPLYKSIMQISTIFSSNFKKDKALVKLVVLFIFSGFVLAALKLLPTNIPYLLFPDRFNDATNAEPRYYKNLANTQSFLLAPQLSNDLVTETILEVFVPTFSYERSLYKNQCNALKSIDKAERKARREAELLCLKQHHRFFINGEEINADIIKTEHSSTLQNGIRAYINLDSVGEGFHKFEVTKDIFDVPITYSVPFYHTS